MCCGVPIDDGDFPPVGGHMIPVYGRMDPHMNIATEPHPFTATVTGSFVYHDTNGNVVGAVPYSITVGDNCCDEHARLAAKRIAEVAARDRSGEEIPHGIRVTAEYDEDRTRT